METILQKALEAIYKILAGGDAYELIVSTAKVLMDANYDNDTKRKMVRDAVTPIINELGKAFLSSIIAFAVTSIQIQLAKETQHA